MRFAVLGTDSDILALAAAAKAAGHEIYWLGDVRPEDSAAMAQLAPGIPVAANWEVLLDHATADAVLVGRGAAGEDIRADQLKRLAADAVPMLVAHPIVDSVLIYYELDMIRRETSGLVRHYNPLVSPPIVAQFEMWTRDGHDAVGIIHQVVCERHVADASRSAVLRHLARDAELLAAVAGGIRHVSAVGPQSADASFASLQVQMASRLATTLRWSVAPPWGTKGGITLTLVGQHGTVTVRVNDSADHGAKSWQLETVVGEERRAAETSQHDSASDAIETLAAALSERSQENRAALSTWDKATQAMEAVDAVELSLQKGRTIEVHQQQLTEQLAFRGTMAAIGCGLLTLGFVVVVVVAMLGGLETLVDRPLMRPWSIVVLAVLALFLLLQTVPLLATKRKVSPQSSDDGNGTRN